MMIMERGENSRIDIVSVEMWQIGIERVEELGKQMVFGMVRQHEVLETLESVDEVVKVGVVSVGLLGELPDELVTEVMEVVGLVSLVYFLGVDFEDSEEGLVVER